MAKREPGLYSVRFGPNVLPEWSVARWTGKAWLIIGASDGFGDNIFAEVGERVYDLTRPTAQFASWGRKAMKHPSTHWFFLLDEKGEPYPVHDVHEWAKKFPEQHLIERTEIAGTGFVVETVFMGKLSMYDFIGSPKSYNVSSYFETIVYAPNGSAVDGDKWNELGSVERGGAKRGHAAKVARWREMLEVDPA